MGVKPEAAVGRGDVLDHNGPISQLPAGRKILQFTIAAEIVQVLILSYSSQPTVCAQDTLTEHRLGSQPLKKKGST